MWSAGKVALCCLACVAVLALAGCASKGSGGTGSGSADETKTIGAHMAGPEQSVNVTPEAFNTAPKDWDLSTPEGAVRSYLDWTSYSYRIAQSDISSPTMSAYEGVRVDSYIQYQLQQSQLIDQTLDSITFGKVTTEATHTLVPAKESWTYRYVSIKTAGKTVGGPYTAAYDTTYTVIKDKGHWVVDSVDAKPVGTVK